VQLRNGVQSKVEFIHMARWPMCFRSSPIIHGSSLLSSSIKNVPGLISLTVSEGLMIDEIVTHN